MKAAKLPDLKSQITSQAVRCENSHICMIDPGHNICEVEYTVGKEVEFIRELKHSCPYNSQYGDGFICYCPVRHELRQKFGI